jgi:hypothetical protein
MTRAALIALALLAAGPVRAAEGRVGAEATILDPAALRLLWPAALPSVTGEINGARFVGRIPALGMAMSMPANARLVIIRQDITGAVITAPGAFEVVSAGPERGYIVRTSLTRDALASLDGLVVGGDLTGEAAASIDVARSPAPEAGGALTVVVQYN